MNLSEWLNGGVGRLSRMAEHFKLSPGAVGQWKTNGVPKDRLLDVRDYTGGEVTLEEMLTPAAPASAPAAQPAPQAAG